MKLLIITQVVDKDDPALGFFHRWIEEFSLHSDHVSVLTLFEGTHSLPENVSVHSLGKTTRHTSVVRRLIERVRYTVAFYRFIHSRRAEYDAVFVHMNPEYVVLGGPFFKHWGKKVALWYTHKAVNLKLRLAARLCDVIFTASQESYRLSYGNVCVLGHGIDTALFSPHPLVHEGFVIGTVSRLTKTKNIAGIIDLAAYARTKRADVQLCVAGSTITPDDEAYEKEMHAYAQSKGFDPSKVFVGALTHNNVPAFLNGLDLFVNLSDTGSLDKAILEAMACAVPVITTNDAGRTVMRKAVPQMVCDTTEQARRLIDMLLLEWSARDREIIRAAYTKYVSIHMSIISLIERIVDKLEESIGTHDVRDVREPGTVPELTLADAARMLFSYLARTDTPTHADAIFILGSPSEAPVHTAYRLWKEGYASIIAFTSIGGTFSDRKSFGMDEWKYYAQRLTELGVPETALRYEGTTTNTLVEAQRAIPFLREQGIDPKRVILVSIPVHQERACRTFEKQHPDITYISIPAEEQLDLDDDRQLERLIQEVDRLDLYGRKGDLVFKELAPQIVEAADIIRKHLILRRML